MMEISDDFLAAIVYTLEHNNGSYKPSVMLAITKELIETRKRITTLELALKEANEDAEIAWTWAEGTNPWNTLTDKHYRNHLDRLGKLNG